MLLPTLLLGVIMCFPSKNAFHFLLLHVKLHSQSLFVGCSEIRKLIIYLKIINYVLILKVHCISMKDSLYYLDNPSPLSAQTDCRDFFIFWMLKCAPLHPFSIQPEKQIQIISTLESSRTLFLWIRLELGIRLWSSSLPVSLAKFVQRRWYCNTVSLQKGRRNR